VLSEQEKRELREMAASESMREEFRTRRHSFGNFLTASGVVIQWIYIVKH
jgi:hypothetical protein